MSELLEDAPSLPEEEPVFQSSGIAFEVKSEDGHPVLKTVSYTHLTLPTTLSV